MTGQPQLGTTLFSQAPTSLGLSTNAQNQQQQAQQQGQPQAGLIDRAPAYFDALLAMTKKQPTGRTNDMPHLHLGLGDLRQQLKKLGGTKQEKFGDERAHYVLAGSGIDLGAAAKDLGSLSGPSGKPQPPDGLADVDVETYLSNLQTKTTLGMIQDGLDRSARDFDLYLEENMAIEWEAQRKRIYDHFGIKQREPPAGETAAAGRESQAGFGRSRRGKQPGTPAKPAKHSVLGGSGLQRSVIGTPSRIGVHQPEFTDVERPSEPRQALGVVSADDRALREKQTKLAEKVRSLNAARIFQRPFPVLSEFAEVTTKSHDPHASHVARAYRAMVEIVGENPEAETTLNNATAKVRQFMAMYMEESKSSSKALDMRKKILAGANAFLEKEFVAEMESLIAKHPHEANLGGRPDIANKIRAYIRLRSARRDLVPDNTELQSVSGEYVWAVVFYLIRSGHVREAAEYVNSHLNAFRGIDRSFSIYLNGYASNPDRRLKGQHQTRCASDYATKSRNGSEGSVDPYRLACYKILGRCEVNNRTFEGLNTDINDWIWLQFNLARESDRSVELANELYGLEELQTSIREIGTKHFPKAPGGDDSNGSFGMFFFLLAVSGLFEEAISYLYPFSYVDAVHFGIALEYYGLLRPSDPLTSENELRSTTSKGFAQINFGRMLGYYTRDFRAADVESAVDYLTLICLNADLPGEAGRRHASLCYEALRELVLETREFSRLIGDIRPDGHRIRGAIEQRAPLIGLTEEDDFIHTVTLQAAAFAAETGRTTDAVLLYHLAGEYDTVVHLVSRALSEAIALEIGEDPMVLLPVKPRAANGQEAEPGSSLSLAAIDDPVELARTMMTMYEQDAMFQRKIQEQNKVACRVLLELSSIKNLVEKKQWATCLDVRFSPLLPQLPFLADISATRKSAPSKFSLCTAQASPRRSATTPTSSRRWRSRWPSTCRRSSCGRSTAARGSARHC
jgi:nuclear pore complex protein Nup93